MTVKKMTQDFINLFSINQYYLILFKASGEPFIDKNGACYFFNTKQEAEHFSSKRPGTSLAEPRHYGHIAKFINELYNKGVTKAKIKISGYDYFKEYVINDEDKKKNDYDTHDIMFNLLRFQQTGEEKYLIGLFNCNFIVPITMPAREEREYPEIKYVALKKDAKRYIIIFTTLREFKNWRSNQVSDYQPLQIDFLKAKRIRKDNGVFINPDSTKMILESDILNKIGGKLK